MNENFDASNLRRIAGEYRQAAGAVTGSQEAP
jgi:hypothetical protein